MENLTADIRFALRWLRRSPAFTLVAVASLAIGIGFNTALFTIVDAVLLRPLPVERPDRLVEVYTSGGDADPYATSSYPDFLDFKVQNQVFVDMLAYSPTMNALALADRSRLAMGETVTGNYFTMLGVKAAFGRTILPDDDKAGAARVAVISNSLWRREFGASGSVIGASIRIHAQPYTIVGVMRPEFTGMFPLLSPELWTPMTYVDDVEPGGIISTVPSPTGNTRLERRGQRWMFVKGRLKAGVTTDAARASLNLLGKQLQASYVQTNKNREISVLPTSDVHIHPTADRTLLPIAAALMLVVGLVLLIACANVASMLLARASGRQKEIGIRLAIGASRRRLVQQLLSESVVIAVLGAVAGTVLAWALMRVVLTVKLPIPIPLSFALRMDGRVLVFTAGITLLASLVAGLAPALKATRPNLIGELKGDVTATSAGGRRWTLRDLLVAVQIAVTLVLLVAAGLLTRSLIVAQRIGVGFRTEGVAVLSMELNMLGYTDASAQQFYKRALECVRAIPGVDVAALAERLPLSINYSRKEIFLPDRQGPNDRGLTVDYARVSPEYFSALGVAILRGRNFAATDTPTSPAVAIVNEAMARKYWPNQDALGKQFHRRAFDGPAVEIVGATANHKVNTVGEDPTPYIHYAVAQSPQTGEEIVARTRGDAGALLGAMRRELLVLEPNIMFFDQQTMEAQVATALLPVQAGALGVSFLDPVAWSAAVVLLLTAATLANLVPARRASVVDPSTALRTD